MAEALGAWARQVRSLDELEEVFQAGLSVDRPVVIDVPIDLREYRAHNAPAVSAVPLQAS